MARAGVDWRECAAKDGVRETKVEGEEEAAWKDRREKRGGYGGIGESVGYVEDVTRA
jgi:hypothetical protein